MVEIERWNFIISRIKPAEEHYLGIWLIFNDQFQNGLKYLVKNRYMARCHVLLTSIKHNLFPKMKLVDLYILLLKIGTFQRKFHINILKHEPSKFDNSNNKWEKFLYTKGKHAPIKANLFVK
jgi:hypothetical protein